jgi:hypothetical protein
MEGVIFRVPLHLRALKSVRPAINSVLKQSSSSFGNTLFTPMILARTENNALLLGTVMSFGGIGGVVGSVVLTICGGPKRRIIGILGGDILINLLGWFLVGLRRNGYVWSLAAFLGFFFLPILNGSS